LAGIFTVILFTLFSGCSDNFNSPLAPNEGMEDFELTGPGAPSTGHYPDDEWENAQNSKILQTRNGENLSSDDIKLEYDPDEFPPGVVPRVHFSNPHEYQFTILPPGIVRNRFVQVTISYSKADLGSVDEDYLQVYGSEGGQYEPIITGIDPANSSAIFITADFARYALARD
jgi:hypothetical protein